MFTRSCPCGFNSTGETKHEANAKMWHHALRDHVADMQKMTPEMLEQKLIEMDA